MRTPLFCTILKRRKLRVAHGQHQGHGASRAVHSCTPSQQGTASRFQRHHVPRYARLFTSTAFKASPAQCATPRLAQSPAARLLLQQSVSTAGPLAAARQRTLCVGAALHCAVALRSLHTSRPSLGWFSSKPPSFAATPVFQEQHRRQQEQQQPGGGDNGGRQQQPRGPVVYRKDFKLASNPLYRFAVRGAQDNAPPPPPEGPASGDPAPSEVLRRFAKLGLGADSGVTKKRGTPSGAGGQQQQRMSAREALRAFAELGRRT